MDILQTIGLGIIGVIAIIGIIRVMFAPYTGFLNLLMECMLLDWLADIVVWVFESITDIWD